MPPDIKTETVVMDVKIGRGVGLPKMDRIGTVDPYVKVRFVGFNAATKHISNNQNPSWNQAVTIPVTLPSLSDLIDIELYDHDVGDADDIIAKEVLSLATIVKQNGLPPRWINFYAVPFSVSKQLRDIAEPTMFCGRVSLAVDIKPAEPGAVLLLILRSDAPQATSWWRRLDSVGRCTSPSRSGGGCTWMCGRRRS